MHRVGSDIVAVHLISDESGVTVVDAGLPGHWKELERELETMGRTLDDIRGVILTHGDSDHLGFAERLRSEHDIPVYIHGGDAAQARGETTKKNPRWGQIKIGPLLGFLGYAARRGAMKVPPVTEVTEVTEGQTLDLPGSPRIIHIPGHTPGSIAVHFDSAAALFVGDAMTTRHVLTGVEGPQPAPFTLDPETAIESFHKLEDLDVRWVLPGHGPPWLGGAGEAVRRVVAGV